MKCVSCKYILTPGYTETTLNNKNETKILLKQFCIHFVHFWGSFVVFIGTVADLSILDLSL